jgi:protein TonB
MDETATRTSGLTITIAVHLGLGAALLAGWQVSRPKPPPAPFILVDRPAPSQPDPVLPAPATRDQPITVAVPAPEWQVAEPEPVVLPPAPQGPAAGLEAATGTGASAEPVMPPPAGPSRSARPLPGTALQPPYPMAARLLGEEGVVVISVAIDANGRVTGASLVRSSGHERLDQAALAQALKRWRFQPALAGGKPVASTRTFSIRFNLADA